MIVKKLVKELLTKSEVKELMQSSTQKIRHKTMKFCSDTYTKEQVCYLKNELRKFGLKEFEIVNLIDLKPTGLVHLDIVIEEMSERFDDKGMQSILELFKKEVE